MTTDRLTEPAFTNSFSFPPVSAERMELQNGMVLFVIDAGSQELCKLEMVAPAGQFHQTQSLMATATNALLREGTTMRSARELAEELDYYGAYLENETGKDKASVTLFSMNRFIEQTLPLFTDIIENPVFPEKEVALYKTNQKQKFLVNLQKVDFVARNNFSRMIFGQNGYGSTTIAEDFDALEPGILANFYRGHYLVKDTYFVLSGRVTKIRDFIAKNLEKLKLTEGNTEPGYEPTDIVGQSNFIEKPDALQSAIRIGKRLFPKTHPDYFNMQILNTLLGGYFGSRLMANIREDKGYTYGIGSGVASMLHDGFFYISTEVGADVCAAALDEIYKEMEVLRQNPVPEEELDLVKNYLMGTFLRSLDGPFALSEKFISLNDYRLTNEFYLDYVNAIRKATPAHLQEVANKYWERNSLTELVVGRK